MSFGQHNVIAARIMGVYKSEPHLAGWSHELTAYGMHDFMYECFSYYVNEEIGLRSDVDTSLRMDLPHAGQYKSDSTQISFIVFCLILARIGFLPFRFSWRDFLEYSARKLASDARIVIQHEADSSVDLPASSDSQHVKLARMSNQQRYVLDALLDREIVSSTALKEAMRDTVRAFNFNIKCFHYFNDVGGFEVWARFVGTYKVYEMGNVDFISADERDDLVESNAEDYRQLMASSGVLRLASIEDGSHESLDHPEGCICHTRSHALGSMQRYNRGVMAWHVGLTKDQQCKWLFMCHSIRVKDELYSGAVTPDELMGNAKARLLPFALLAARHGITPHYFDWSGFLNHADFLWENFSGNNFDAIDEFGVEDVLVRSLRLTAIDIYGNSPTEHGIYCDEYLEVWDEIMASYTATCPPLKEVGGHMGWLPYLGLSTRTDVKENNTAAFDVLDID